MNIKMILLLMVSATLMGGSSSPQVSNAPMEGAELLYAKQVDSLQEKECKKVCQYFHYEKRSNAINSNIRGK